MGAATGIEWTDATWNPLAGCSVHSPGCAHCYAMKMAHRFAGVAGHAWEGLTLPGKAVWNGTVRLNEAALMAPLRWKRPRRIFVNSMSDLFHEAVPDAWIDRVFAVMALAPQHTFQVLTKRSARQQAYLDRTFCRADILRAASEIDAAKASILYDDPPRHVATWPLRNVWLGVSAEDQARADERIPLLLDTPAARRFVSCEPLLGPIDLTMQTRLVVPSEGEAYLRARIDWVIAGGESGGGARPMHPDWVRGLRDQCAAAGVPFFFKQWGEWYVTYDRDIDDPDWRRCDVIARRPGRWVNLAGGHGFHGDRVCYSERVGKKSAGAMLDGVAHKAWPE